MFIIEAFKLGGPAMYLILGFCVFTLAFIIERYMALYVSYKPAAGDLRKNILTAISYGDLQTAERVAIDSKSALGRVTSLGIAIKSKGGGDEEVQARMDEQLTKEIAFIDKRTGFLAMFGNVATLLGLLGTIMGMIHSFAAVASASPMDRATLLSKGIAEAMNCTAFGLIVAIPALVCYAVFQNKTDALVADMTQRTSEIYHDLLFHLNPTAPSVKNRNMPTENISREYHA